MPAPDRRPIAVLGAAMAVWTVLLLVWAGDRIFALDEWEYVINRHEWSVDSILKPINGHLLALPLLVYKLLLSVFGATSHLPFTLLTAVMHLLVVGLLFALLQRRLGSWVALAPAVLVLFLGAGWEVILSTAAVQNEFGIAAGLGVFVALDRGGRYGDVSAAALLAASLASFSIGIAFAAGAAAWILLAGRGGAWRGRAWVVVAPLALYAIWFLWATQFEAGDSIRAFSLASLGSGVFDQLSAIAAGTTGLFRPSGAAAFPDTLLIETSRTSFLVFVMAGLLAWRIARGPALRPIQVAALVTLGVYLLLIASSLDDIRPPEASRYVYMGSVLTVLAASLLLEGVEFRGRWVAAAAAVLLGFSLLANVAEMKVGGDFYERESAYNRAELAALELIRDDVDPGAIPEADPMPIYPHRDLTFNAGDYFSFIDAYGSPVGSLDELTTAPDDAREGADALLLRLRPFAVEPGGEPAAEGAAPVVGATLNAQVEADGACNEVSPILPDGPALATFAVPPEGIYFQAERGQAAITMGRFADDVTVKLPSATDEGTLVVPADASEVPWRAGFSLPGGGRVCTAG